MKIEYADLHRILTDATHANLQQARALLAAGAMCHWCSIKLATTRRGGELWCARCAAADRLVRKHAAGGR